MSIKKERNQLKPQDVLILLKLFAASERNLKMMELAYELGISQSEISEGLERLRFARLVDTEKKHPFKSAAYELLVHGIKYIFPVAPGPILGGVPTAHCAGPLSKQIISNELEKYVWPSSEGSIRGQAIEPLYPSVPLAALRDSKLYDLLVLVDSIRMGRIREQTLAQEELKKRIFDEDHIGANI